MVLDVCPIIATPAERPGGPAVLVPGLARFPPALRDVCALLPVTDINAALFEALEAGLAVQEEEAVGLFLTDPFLNLADAARRLAAGRVPAVANYPTVQVLDGPSAQALASVGHSFEQECVMLEGLAARGLRLIGYAASRPAFERLTMLGADRIVLLDASAAPGRDHPGVRLFRHAQAFPGQSPRP